MRQVAIELRGPVDADSEEDRLARRLLGERYGHTQDLTRWLREALPVAVDLGSQ